jgi:hypothetical protein
VADLLSDSRWMYKVCSPALYYTPLITFQHSGVPLQPKKGAGSGSSSLSPAKGLLGNPLIQQIIDDCWFSKKTSQSNGRRDAIVQLEQYEGTFPSPAIGLVLLTVCLYFSFEKMTELTERCSD